MDTTSVKVIQLLKEVLKTDAVDENSEIGMPYQWDSLNHITILLKFEKLFNVEIGPAMLIHLTSVKKISDFLISKKE